ncbi:Hypothetical protein SRAE_1000183000 [Strongyloides ratti]|uniref:Uncharacterized protein n=1 Tax=Strongyloides ratti TaxID=34506 RepID=A0A090L7S2_STRRB|nr:Hypothetical protein SRAE_1000183000 [Strongyloides ratti]CEF63570.1 Hypothetical protein SRAE_1000183000 [Strongyloides ratti]
MISHTNLRFLHSNFFQPCPLTLTKSFNYNDYSINSGEIKICSSGIILSKSNTMINNFNNVTLKMEKNEAIESSKYQFLDPMQAFVDSIKEGFDLSELCFD